MGENNGLKGVNSEAKVHTLSKGNISPACLHAKPDQNTQHIASDRCACMHI